MYEVKKENARRPGAARMLAGGILALGALALGACDPVSLGVGAAATGGVVLAQERPAKEAVSDTAIRLSINDLWLKEDLDLYQRLGLSVNEGRVLVTGLVPSQEDRLTAIRLVWQVDGVREVINEIEVAESEGISGYARDVWISTQLRSRLTFDTSIRAVNYSVETVGGTIYLMGIAQDQAELDRVIGHARQIPYVRRVVSHVRMKDDPAPVAASA
jgi:osmotically-inducible protein OsmY